MNRVPFLPQDGDYDLGGFCVGVVEKDSLFDGKSIVQDDLVIGVATSGIHSNGYSLVRKIVYEAAGKQNDDPFDRVTTVGEEMLRPTTIYVKAVRDVLMSYKVKSVVHGIAHITGGGIAENIKRILPEGVSAEIDASVWDRPTVFDWLQENGNVKTDEMYRVFNMGIGLAVIASPFYAEKIRRTFGEHGLEAWVIGSVAEGDDGVVVINR